MNKDELSALQKFALLPNINIFEEGELTKVDKEQDEGYTPTLYYYNKSSGEFYEIAEGIEDIYFKTEYAEDITAKKGTDFKEVKERPLFVEYE